MMGRVEEIRARWAVGGMDFDAVQDDTAALLSRITELEAAQAQAAPVLAHVEQWVQSHLAADPNAWDRADNALVQAYRVWRAAREG